MAVKIENILSPDITRRQLSSSPRHRKPPSALYACVYACSCIPQCLEYGDFVFGLFLFFNLAPCFLGLCLFLHESEVLSLVVQLHGGII